VSTADRYGPPLERAIQAMRDQMAEPENVAKPDWSHLDTPALVDGVYRNLDWLDRSREPGDRAEAFRRAANVANYAWMLADNVPDVG
jgi:hypothetical protein